MSTNGSTAGSSGSARPARGSASHTLRLPAELALIGVGAATLVGFRRLFTDWSFLGRPLVVLALSSLLAMGLRRRRVSLIPATLISVVACVLVCTWVFYGSTTVLGLPTSLTLDQFSADVREAVQLFRDVEAPAEALRGFVVGTALAAWIIAFLADWSAFRLWAPFEATLPAAGLFLFASLFGADQYRVPSALLFLAAVLTFLLVHRASRLEASGSWLRGDSQRGSRALVRAGMGLAAVAVVLGAAVGPLLPGSRAEPVVDWKELGGGDGTRVTVSPLVDIQARLVEQSDLEAFTVRSEQRAYWRLTALDSFDGRLWRSSRRFGKVKGELEATVSTRGPDASVRQDFVIKSLSQLWLPAAFEPQEIFAGDVDTRWEPSTSTLIVDQDSSDGLEYSVISEVPAFPTDFLKSAVGGPPESLREQFLQLPDDFSPRVSELARQVTAGAERPYDQALLLQNYLRSDLFTYSLEVRGGHSGDRLEEFLFGSRTGYCEQFAGAYAAMARSIGLPARVAVGFTPGDPDPADPSLYHVKGKHAHAWPEVYIPSRGWVLFEPTPSRGAPGAGYTGVDEQQDSVGQPGQLPESPGTTSPLPSSSGSSANPDAAEAPVDGELPIDSVGTGTTPEEADDGAGWAGWVLYLVAGVAILYVGGLLGGRALVRAVRRRRTAGTNERVDLAWREAVESLGVVGLHSNGSETPAEFADRADRRSGVEAPELRSLAHLATEARYSGRDLGPEGEEAARAGSVAVLDRVRAQTTLSQRLGYQLSPRVLWQEGRRASRRLRGQRTRAG